jgi:integrase/recombinase XerC
MIAPERRTRTEIAKRQNRAVAPVAAVGQIVDPLDLGECTSAFLRTLEGRNASPETIRAYTTSLTQFLTYLAEHYPSGLRADEVTQEDIEEYLTALARRGLSGVTRANRLAAIRELFRFLVRRGLIPASPAFEVSTPKRERRGRVWLRPDEYTKLLSAAGGNPRDFCILQLFLQTGVRVSELVSLDIDDADLPGKLLRVRAGKGQQARDIPLEKKAIRALKSWLDLRGYVATTGALFPNRYGQRLSDRSVRELLTGYREAAGITKKATPHSLRHTFASYKAKAGVPLPMLKDMLGHAKLSTTQIYTHTDQVDAHKVMEGTSL